jgi:hypothetical protein
MVENPLFYRSIVALNRDLHRDLRLQHGQEHFAFAKNTHMMPAVIDEFGVASRYLPIVFLPGAQQPTSVFLVGLRPSENILVDDDGRWTDGYVPAFARRYPFMLGEVAQGTPVACIDEAFEGFSKSEGDRLFAEDGSDTPFLRDRLRLINDYFAAAKRTDVLLRTLDELQLLRPVTIESKLQPGSSAILHGFLTVDEARLNALSDADFLRLRADGLLPAIYAHILSLQSVDRLRRLAPGNDGRGDEERQAPEAKPRRAKATQ